MSRHKRRQQRKHEEEQSEKISYSKSSSHRYDWKLERRANQILKMGVDTGEIKQSVKLYDVNMGYVIKTANPKKVSYRKGEVIHTQSQNPMELKTEWENK